MDSRESIIERALSDVVADPETGCWLSPARTSSGYPTVSLGKRGKQTSIARLILGIHESGRDVVARHKCDNKTCIRPEHLEPGTQKDNIHDAVVRGHMHGRNCTTRDEHPRTKIKVADIPSIIERHFRGETWNEIGASFGASSTAARLATIQWRGGKYAWAKV